MKNSSRIFISLIMGFLAIISVINMTHHRKLAIQPKSERDILAAVFKNDPVNKGGKMNDGRNKPSSAFPVLEK